MEDYIAQMQILEWHNYENKYFEGIFLSIIPVKRIVKKGTLQIRKKKVEDTVFVIDKKPSTCLTAPLKPW